MKLNVIPEDCIALAGKVIVVDDNKPEPFGEDGVFYYPGGEISLVVEGEVRSYELVVSETGGFGTNIKISEGYPTKIDKIVVSLPGYEAVTKNDVPVSEQKVLLGNIIFEKIELTEEDI